jgi:hypothetical protein
MPGRQSSEAPDLRRGRASRNRQESFLEKYKPYVSIAELAELTPWTDQAIRTMISRGILRKGKHYFHVGRRPVFKWAAIVAFIEQGEARERVPHYREQLSQLSLWDEDAKSGGKPAPSK